MEFQLMSARYWSDFKRILNDYPQIANEFKVQIIDTTEEQLDELSQAIADIALEEKDEEKDEKDE